MWKRLAVHAAMAHALSGLPSPQNVIGGSRWRSHCRGAPPEIFQQAKSEDAQPCGTCSGWTPSPYGPEEFPMGLTIAPHLTKHTLVTRERPRRMQEGLCGTTHDPTRLALSSFGCAPHSHSTEPQKRKARSEQTSLTWPHKHNNSMAAGVDLTANSHRQAA